MAKNGFLKKHFFYQQGRLVGENTEHALFLRFFYANGLGRLLRPIIRGRCWSRLYGAYLSTRLSRRKIAPFVKKHNIRMQDFQVPPGGYASFNDFFIRKIRQNVRPIDANSVTVVSPADSKLLVLNDLATDSRFFVKHQQFDIHRFVQDNDLADRMMGGCLMIFRLAPYDYHRFHFPLAGNASMPVPVGGMLESVNPLVYKVGLQPLLSNERAVISLQTARVGLMLMVPVGAMFVGSISYTYQANRPVAKGQEAGYFAFGGSTVVLLFERGRITPQEQFLRASAEGYEVAVKMGQAVATINQ